MKIQKNIYKYINLFLYKIFKNNKHYEYIAQFKFDKCYENQSVFRPPKNDDALCFIDRV